MAVTVDEIVPPLETLPQTPAPKRVLPMSTPSTPVPKGPGGPTGATGAPPLGMPSTASPPPASPTPVTPSLPMASAPPPSLPPTLPNATGAQPVATAAPTLPMAPVLPNATGAQATATTAPSAVPSSTTPGVLLPAKSASQVSGVGPIPGQEAQWNQDRQAYNSPVRRTAGGGYELYNGKSWIPGEAGATYDDQGEKLPMAGPAPTVGNAPAPWVGTGDNLRPILGRSDGGSYQNADGSTDSSWANALASPDQLSALLRAGTPGVSALGASAGVGTPASLPMASPASPASSSAVGVGSLAVPGGPSFTPTSSDGGNYLDKTITPNQGVDRVGLGRSIFDTFQKATDPAYKASILDAERNGAALGQIGSGGLRTSVGNLANQRGLQLDTARDTFAQNALAGSIDDAYKNIGIAQQQQGFQAGRADTNRSFGNQEQGQAFDQAIQEIQLNEALQEGDFDRYLRILNAGQTGNPSDTALALSNNYGNQSAAAGQAAGNLIGASSANTASGIPDWFQEYLRSIGQGNVPRATSTGVDTPLPMAGAYG